jgi:hypothetical protein
MREQCLQSSHFPRNFWQKILPAAVHQGLDETGEASNPAIWQQPLRPDRLVKKDRNFLEMHDSSLHSA